MLNKRGEEKRPDTQRNPRVPFPYSSPHLAR
jgi:hypothetical protein